MNKKGQSLIMFIIFLPVFLGFFALIIDVGLMYNAKIKGEALIYDAKKENIDVEDYFKINDIDITSINKKVQNDSYCVIIKYKIKSVFGSLIGYKEYDIEASDCEE